jgi:hypothetical protein
MKKGFIILIVTISFLLVSYSSYKKPRPVVTPLLIELEPITISKPTLKYEKLIEALIQVESEGIEYIHGDIGLKEGPSVGVLQIRPIMVREVNRILRIKKINKKFKLKDRYSRKKSIEMFNIWRMFYHPDGNFEKISRTWNGGPKGYLKKSTVGYWMEVQNELSLINDKRN